MIRVFALPSISARTRAVLLALFVTFLWSTSWVFIKIGLQDVPALTFAGLRYATAGVALLAVTAGRPGSRQRLAALTRRDWLRLIGFGLLFIAVVQGAQYVSLAYLPASTVSLLLNFTTVVVAVIGIVFLAERPRALQWGGMVLFLAGVLLFFYPAALPTESAVGLAAAGMCVMANAAATVLGRAINRAGSYDALTVTLVSICAGGLALLVAGIALNGWPTLTLAHWLMVGWLALVNTAFAFTLWNTALQDLPAVEASIINGTMLIQIAALAWIFLGEALDAKAIVALGVAALGALLVQWRR